jgi:hypothetical protein
MGTSHDGLRRWINGDGIGVHIGFTNSAKIALEVTSVASINN